MATYLVWSGGNNSSGTEASGWANAYTAFASAVTAATTDNDIIKVHKTHQEEVGADVTYTFTANVNVLCVDKDASDAISVMGTGGWIGNSTTNRTVNIVATAKTVYAYGVTFRTSGSTLDQINIGGTATSAGIILEEVYLWNGNTNTTSFIGLRASGANSAGCRIKLINPVFRFGDAAQSILIGTNVEIVGGSISASGSAVTTIFKESISSDLAACNVLATGLDLSAASSTANIVGDCTTYPLNVELSNSKLPSSFVGLAAQSDATFGTGQFTMFNCSGGDTHYHMGYYNVYGSLVCVTNAGVYANDGALFNGTDHVTWKIDTSAYASVYTPFVTPWIEKYHSGTSAIAPYIEVLRDGSATAYNDNEVWAECSVQNNTGFPLASFVNDRMILSGTPAAQTTGVGVSGWTNENASAWSGKCVMPSVTPAEIGMLRMRVCVGVNTSTTSLYIDPKIRT